MIQVRFWLMLIVSILTGLPAYNYAEVQDSLIALHAGFTKLQTGLPLEGVLGAIKRLLAAKKADNKEIIQVVLKYYPEMSLLAGKVEASPEGLAKALEGSPSKQIYGNQHTEFDRTAVGIFNLFQVLNNDYDEFVGSQELDLKLSKESFEKLRKFTKNILKTDEDVDGMITYMVINDLGKITSVIQEIEQKTGFTDVDHDKILLEGLTKIPEISPSFQRLSKKYQDMIINGLKAQFNIGQFIQGENVPASLSGLKGLNKDSLDFYLLHALFDIAGALGQVNPKGSRVMTEPTYLGFDLSISAIERLAQGENVKQVYDDYLSERGKRWGLSIGSAQGRALIRINLMLRSPNEKSAQEVVIAFNELPENVKAILNKELGISGVDDQWAILVYYAPALLVNTVTGLTQGKSGVEKSKARSEALKTGMTTLARLFQEARVDLIRALKKDKSKPSSGVYTLFAGKIAEQAKKDPQAMNQMRITITPKGEDGVATFENVPVIDTTKFEKQGLNEIQKGGTVVIGIGGGSDVIQATQLAKLLPNQDDIVAIISIRTKKAGSGRVGEERVIQNPAKVVAEGVYLMQESTTSGERFFENLPSQLYPKTYLVFDEINNTLESRIRAAMADAIEGTEKKIKTIIGVDTGGDALFPIKKAGEVTQGRTTPDQDIRVLQTLEQFLINNEYTIYTAEIAVGIDSPDNAQEILEIAYARYYRLKPEQKKQVLDQYIKWRMNGPDPDRYGKTSLAWQGALRGITGLYVLPLPTKVVVDKTNPWIPFVILEPSMEGIFFMTLENHLRALGATN